MIVDCHAHVFQHWSGAFGHPSAAVHPRDDELRVGKLTPVRSSAGGGQLLPSEVFDLTDVLIEPRTTIAITRFQCARQALDPVGGPCTYPVALA